MNNTLELQGHRER
ncbi:hypothetical protein CP8484711_1214A, partial [Chlamydia psittaci 84-8471/1]